MINGTFQYEQALDHLRSGDREMDPLKSGLYLRYNLLVAYLLDQKGIGIREMLDRDFEPACLEAEMLGGNHGS
jgi:hypothetical protein